MARGQNSNRMRRMNNPRNIKIVNKKNEHIQLIHHMNEAINKHWESMPSQARSFLLDKKDLGLHKLAKFWSSPSCVQYTCGEIAGSVCSASWFIALNYLKLGMLSEAVALTLNGAFFHQCYNTSIEKIAELCGPNFSSPVKDYKLPLFSKGFYSTRSPQTMDAYLEKVMSKEHQHMMASFVNISSPENVMRYVGQIGDDWGSGSSMKSQHKPTSKTSDEFEKNIQLTLVDGSNNDNRHTFDIGWSTTLKTLFNEYAEKRAVSLRSLRFSYEGKALFLSSVGNKTPGELNMRDHDIITVHVKSIPESRSCNPNKTCKDKSTKKSKMSKKSPKKSKAKGGHVPNKLGADKTVKAVEDCKAWHSKMLSEIHEELEPKLRLIRMRLNALCLERQPPKKKKSMVLQKKGQISPDFQVLPGTEISGKAGKPCFSIHVGEVQHLYKSSKPYTLSSRKCSPDSLNLDLHGCTREEALAKLDGCLPMWVETAMRGSYPFIVRATIICGCGNQLLSETVQQWIKSTKSVCHAPKIQH